MARDTGPRRKKPPKRGYKPERPIVSVRLPQIIFEDISTEAKAQNVSLTDVVYRRLLAYQRYEEIKDEGAFREMVKAHIEAHPELKDEGTFWRMVGAKTKASPRFQGDRDASWKQIERRDIEADLKRLGYTRITGPGGVVWAEPDASIPASIVKALKDRKE